MYSKISCYFCSYEESDMSRITKEQYEIALERIEELLPLVTDETPANDRNAIELTMMSDIVIGYEKEHYPKFRPWTTKN